MAFALLSLARGPQASARWWWASSLALLLATLSPYAAWPPALLAWGSWLVLATMR